MDWKIFFRSAIDLSPRIIQLFFIRIFRIHDNKGRMSDDDFFLLDFSKKVNIYRYQNRSDQVGIKNLNRSDLSNNAYYNTSWVQVKVSNPETVWWIVMTLKPAANLSAIADWLGSCSESFSMKYEEVLILTISISNQQGALIVSARLNGLCN